MRPRTILTFDWLFLSARFLSLASTFYYLIDPPAETSEPDLDGLGIVIYHFIQAFLALWPMALWFFVSRKASQIAKWLLIALVAYEALAVGVDWEYHTAGAPTYFRLTLASVVILDVTAVVMLNLPASRDWFRLRRRFGKVDPAAFE